MKNNKSIKGFTLTELVVVIAVIAVIIAIVIPTFNNIVNNSEGSAALAEAKDLYAEYVRSNSKNGKIDNDLYIKVEDGYVHYLNGKAYKEEDGTFLYDKLYVNDDLLDANGKYIESKFIDHESIAQEFLKDYKNYSKTNDYTIENNVAGYWKSNTKKITITRNDIEEEVSLTYGFWLEEKNYNKWSWLYNQLKEMGINQLGLELELNDILQNISLFFLNKNKESWDDNYGSLIESNAIDCSSVDFDDYFRLIPRELFFDKDYEFSEPPLFEINFELSGGEFSEDVVLNYNEGEIIELPVPVKAGYTFEGWYQEDVKKDTLTMPGNNVSLEARWELNTYTINYDLGNIELVRYENINMIIADFLKDYNECKNTTHTPDTFYSIGAWDEIGQASTFLYNINYKDKWSWLVDYIASIAGPNNKNAWANFKNYSNQAGLNSANENYIYCIAYELRGFVGQKQYTRNANYITANYADTSIQENIWNYTNKDFIYTYNVETETFDLPVINNSNFVGWYIGEEKIESITKGSIGNIELTAKWKGFVGENKGSIALAYYSNTGLAAGNGSPGNGKNYICDREGIRPITGVKGNNLKSQNKILLVYDSEKIAYKVVAKNSGTAQVAANDMGVNWTHAICSISNNIQDLVEVGQYIVIETTHDFSDYEEKYTEGFPLTNTKAYIYDANQYK